MIYQVEFVGCAGNNQRVTMNVKSALKITWIVAMTGV